MLTPANGPPLGARTCPAMEGSDETWVCWVAELFAEFVSGTAANCRCIGYVLRLVTVAMTLTKTLSLGATVPSVHVTVVVPEHEPLLGSCRHESERCRQHIGNDNIFRGVWSKVSNCERVREVVANHYRIARIVLNDGEVGVKRS